jgi:nuclear protein localization family protein 4
MILRIRSNVGVWRVETAPAATVADVLRSIQQTRPHVQYEQPLCFDPTCKNTIDTTTPLTEQGLSHGSMIYCRVVPESCADHTAPIAASNTPTSAAAPSTELTNMRRVIDKTGQIKLVPTSEIRDPEQDRGFRKGMLPLRDMKMQWTLNDFIAMDSQFEFKMKRQEESICKQVSLDIPSVSDFQAYLQKFKCQRFGFLYGTFVQETRGEDVQADAKPTKVRVEAIYEPPQEFDAESAEGFIPLDDPKEEVVEQIAQLLGWRKVGWIYGHKQREKGFVMSAAEVILAAEYQLEAAGGVEETPFVTVKVAPGADGTVSVEAFQVSQQCMAMVAEQALEVHADPKSCKVNETFTAIQEGKPSPTVENNFFLTVVPIAQHISEKFIADFPRLNRSFDDRMPSQDEMKRTLQKSGSSGWSFEDRLADFNLLIYLSDFLDLNADYPKICAALTDRATTPLADGYKLIIKSLAGIEGSY